MQPDITILGECMVELSPTDTPRTMRVGFAGDTFNTAWYLAQLWRDTGCVRYATKIGLDETSAAFTSFAAAVGIATNLIETHPKRGMGLYMIHLHEGERSFSYWRDSSAARTLADDPEFLKNALDASENIYLSGITVAILPPEGRDRLAAAITQARAAGRRVFFDTNLRPKLWDSSEEMRQETERFASCADVILPSFDDEAAHFGHANIEATAAHYKDLGASLVVVKNANRPVLVSHEAGMEIVPIEPADTPIDTTAAGDSFNAGFIADFVLNGDAIAAVTKASLLAGRVIMSKGALVETVQPPSRKGLT